MKKKIFMGLVATTLVIGTLVGCDSKDSTTTTEATEVTQENDESSTQEQFAKVDMSTLPFDESHQLREITDINQVKALMANKESFLLFVGNDDVEASALWGKKLELFSPNVTIPVLYINTNNIKEADITTNLSISTFPSMTYVKEGAIADSYDSFLSAEYATSTDEDAQNAILSKDADKFYSWMETNQIVQLNDINRANSNDYGLSVVNYEELKTAIANKESFILYIGRYSCPYCKPVGPTLSEYSADMNTKIYYFNTTNYKTNIVVETADFMNENPDAVKEDIKTDADATWQAVKDELGFEFTPCIFYYKDGVQVGIYDTFVEDDYMDATGADKDALLNTAKESFKAWLLENGVYNQTTSENATEGCQDGNEGC